MLLQGCLSSRLNVAPGATPPFGFSFFRGLVMNEVFVCDCGWAGTEDEFIIELEDPECDLYIEVCPKCFDLIEQSCIVIIE